MSKEDFIEKAKQIHGEHYDYSLVDYKNMRTKVKIICNIHKIDFLQLPLNHLKFDGCPLCKKKNQQLKNKGRKSKSKLSTEEVIKRLKNKFGNNDYDYSLVDYVNRRTKVKIICKKCGRINEVYINTTNLCNHCSHIKAQENRKINDFEKRANEIHNYKYEYLTKYANIRTPIKIKCKNCGNVFEQKPNTHLEGHGCPKCGSKNRNRKTTAEFIEEANNIHDYIYDYSKVNYINNCTKVKIICKKCRKEFNQQPRDHLSGKGCPYCKSSSGEKKIAAILKTGFETQKTFDDLINPKTGKKLRYDFYVEEKNLLIEYNGIQHYEPIEYFGGEEAFKQIQFRDKLKIDYAAKNNINLLIIKYDENIKEKLKL